jgi:hypothetical protein
VVGGDIITHSNAAYSLFAPPSVVAGADSNNAGAASEGLVHLQFSFAAIGPPGAVAIINVASLGGVTGQGDASFHADTDIGAGILEDVCAGPACAAGTAASWAVVSQLDLLSGSVHTAVLDAGAGAGTNFGNVPVLNASAFVDPLFSIDPSTPNAALWSLEFSPGIVNAAPIPEPSVLALMLFGFGGLACAKFGGRARGTPHHQRARRNSLQPT